MHEMCSKFETRIIKIYKFTSGSTGFAAYSVVCLKVSATHPIIKETQTYYSGIFSNIVVDRQSIQIKSGL